jgi:hypothetical protein
MRKPLMAAMLVAPVMLAPAFAAWDPDRIVTAVNSEARAFSCQAEPGEPSYTYKTTGKTVFRTYGQRVRLSFIWNKGSMRALKVGDTVSVRFHMQGDDRIAERVAIRPKK